VPRTALDAGTRSSEVAAPVGRHRSEVVSVNVGGLRTVDWHGRRVTSGIWKEPVDGPVAIEGVNLAGDDQADRRVDGGPDKPPFDASAAVHTSSSSRHSPDPLKAGRFSSRFPPRLLTDMTLQWFGISACTAPPEDLPPSRAQHGS
jgi:hypothetical protein